MEIKTGCNILIFETNALLVLGEKLLAVVQSYLFIKKFVETFKQIGS